MVRCICVGRKENIGLSKGKTEKEKKKMEDLTKIENLRGVRSRLQTKRIEAQQYLEAIRKDLEDVEKDIMKETLRQECEEKSNTVGNPKSEILFEKAFKFGEGYKLRVISWYSALVDLIK